MIKLICRFLYLFLIINSVIPVKANSQPAQEWLQRYNGPANSFDIVSKLLLDDFGNAYVYGSSIGVGTLTDFTIIKYNSSGKTLWEQRYNGAGNSTDQISSAVLDNSGNSFITGFTTATDFSNKIITAKYDSSGNLIWIKTFNQTGYTNGFGQSVAIDKNGNIFTSGFLKNSVTGFYDMVLIKYSNTGNEMMSQLFNGAGNGDDVPVSIKIDNENNVIICGSTKSLLNGLDMIVWKYNESLALQWAKTFNGTSNSDDRLTSLTIDSQNNIVFCGIINNNISYLDYFYAKLNSNGILLWEKKYNGTGNNIDIPSAVITDNLNNIYLTGYSRTSATIGSEDIFTIKTDSAGNTVWAELYNGNVSGTDQGNSLALDSKGNVYVCGASDRGNVQMTYALIKYNSSGVLQWFQNYSQVKIPEDFAYEVAVDKSDNVIVTGISLDSITDYDIVSIKYSQTIGIYENSTEQPNNFSLFQNYPNPFNPTTKINYELRITNYVSLKIFDVLGHEVESLVDEKQNAGSYTAIWNASEYPAGIYFYRLKTILNGKYYLETKSMILLK
ncbi:MAG: SBBP repeat-containing protein [Ignavibacteria bacterium]|nr:SBBP repeat-containing protein [Ignavibacteria bacterium]